MNQAKIKEELYRTIESIPIERLGEVLDFIKVISRDPAELFPEELKELDKARKEVAEGKFVTLEERHKTDRQTHPGTANKQNQGITTCL